MTAPRPDVTTLLRAWGRGDAEAGDRLVPLVYDDLRRQAARYLKRERREHTLRPTALVHEAYLRLAGQRNADWKNRAQFFAVAAQAMRRVLVDHARRRGAGKRGKSWCRVSLEEVAERGLAAVAFADLDVLALEDALTELGRLAPEKVRLVELRFFGGLSLEETAAVMEVSPSTVGRDWRLARAWLFRRLRKEPSGTAGPAS
jgi:RNA polymerase sigma factor (TIGR02999 family)